MNRSKDERKRCRDKRQALHSSFWLLITYAWHFMITFYNYYMERTLYSLGLCVLHGLTACAGWCYCWLTITSERDERSDYGKWIVIGTYRMKDLSKKTIGLITAKGFLELCFSWYEMTVLCSFLQEKDYKGRDLDTRYHIINDRKSVEVKTKGRVW